MRTEEKQLKLIWKKIGQLDRHYYKNAVEPKGAFVSESINYLNDDNPMHELEVVLPNENNQCLPVIINIHGGAWIYGEKDSYYKYYCMELAQFNYAVISINYRLAFEEPFPSMIEDIFAVFAWLENQTSYDFDLNNIFLVGDSAGAHLAALSAQITQSDILLKQYQVTQPKFTIRGLGLSSGVYDFDELMEGDNELPLKKTLLEVMFKRIDFRNNPIYPYASVSKNLNSDFTPAYVVSSLADPLTHESKRFVEELSEKGCHFKQHFFDKSLELPHVFNLKSIYPESDLVNSEMIAFFDSLKA